MAAPVAAYGALAWSTRVDAPVLDDFDALLRFLVRDREAAGWGERLANLLSPHVDHRLVTSRLVALGTTRLLGRLDFALLSAVGHLALLGLFAVLAASRWRRAGADALCPLLPVALLMFQPQAFDVVHWPTASIATHGVLLLAAACLALLARGGRLAMAGGWACAAAALLTQGNGAAVFPVAVVALALAGRRRQAAVFAVAAMPPLLAYALAYRGRSPVAPLARLAELPETAHYLLNFLGAAPAFATAPWAALAGLALLVAVGLLSARRAVREDLPVHGLMLFVLATAVGNAWLRAGIGPEYALAQSRYRVTSALLVALCHLGVWDALEGRRARSLYAAGAVLGALVFSVASFVRYAPAVGQQSAIAARTLARSTLTGEGLQHPEPERAAAILARAEALGLYRPSPERLVRFLDRPVSLDAPAAPSGGVAFAPERVVHDDALLLVEGVVTAPAAAPGTTRVYVVVGEGASRRILTARAVPLAEGRLRLRSLAPRSAAGSGALGALVVDRELVGLAASSRRIPPPP